MKPGRSSSDTALGSFLEDLGRVLALSSTWTSSDPVGAVQATLDLLTELLDLDLGVARLADPLWDAPFTMSMPARPPQAAAKLEA